MTNEDNVIYLGDQDPKNLVIDNDFKLNIPDQDRSMTFHIDNDKGEPEEMLKISEDGFFYKGERVEDVNDIYNRFSEWMSKADHK